MYWGQLALGCKRDAAGSLLVLCFHTLCTQSALTPSVIPAVCRHALNILANARNTPHTTQVGAHLLSRLRGLQARHPALIGDVRGRGLFLGIEVVRDPASKAPAPATAK